MTVAQRMATSTCTRSSCCARQSTSMAGSNSGPGRWSPTTTSCERGFHRRSDRGRGRDGRGPPRPTRRAPARRRASACSSTARATRSSSSPARGAPWSALDARHRRHPRLGPRLRMALVRQRCCPRREASRGHTAAELILTDGEPDRELPRRHGGPSLNAVVSWTSVDMDVRPLAEPLSRQCGGSVREMEEPRLRRLLDRRALSDLRARS